MRKVRLFMDWINVKTQPPKKYQEVIICSDEGKVKSAIYLGDGKYNTFLNVVYWQSMPEAPENIENDKVEPVKRGRKKKSV